MNIRDVLGQIDRILSDASANADKCYRARCDAVGLGETTKEESDAAWLEDQQAIRQVVTNQTAGVISGLILQHLLREHGVAFALNIGKMPDGSIAAKFADGDALDALIVTLMSGTLGQPSITVAPTIAMPERQPISAKVERDAAGQIVGFSSQR